MSANVRINGIFDAVTDLLRARTGMIFPPTRRADVESGTRKVMAKAGIANAGECLVRLQTDPDLLDELISEIAIGETYFFRERGHFAFIREAVIPEIRRQRGPEHIFRVWSAGCASGEEPYSLAIMFEEEGLFEHARIVSTDISRAALTRAREAAYGAWSFRGCGEGLTSQYFCRSGTQFKLAERFRRRVEFAYLNLAQDAYPATNIWRMDLILCRNVLIYLDATTIRDVAHGFYETLADGGFLMTGPSDPALAEYAPFETLNSPAGIVYRKPTIPKLRVEWSPAASPSPPLADIDLIPSAAIPNHRPAIGSSPPIKRNISARPVDPLAKAHEALARGDNARVIELTRPLKTDASAVALHIRALANFGEVETAAKTAAEAAARHPASIEIGFLWAVLLINLNRHRDADLALRRILYLDRSLAVVHFTLGTMLYRLGDLTGAVRAYRNAHDIAARRPPDEIMPLSDGEMAGRLADAAAAQVAFLAQPQEPLR